jgi:thioredoxin 1
MLKNAIIVNNLPIDAMNQLNQMDRAELDKLHGVAVIEFGATLCVYCQASQALIADALAHYSLVTHIKIEDGKGQRLGRTYAVKLWPTLILLKDGKEVARIVRPIDTQIITDALKKIA